MQTRTSSPSRCSSPLPHSRGIGRASVNAGSTGGAPVGGSVGSRDGRSPHGDDALGLLVNVVDGRRLLSSHVIQSNDEVVDDLALKIGGEISDSQPLGNDQRGGKGASKAKITKAV